MLAILFIGIIQQVPSAHVVEQKLFLQGKAVGMNFGKQGTPFQVASRFCGPKLFPVDVLLDEVLFEGKHRGIRFWMLDIGNCMNVCDGFK